MISMKTLLAITAALLAFATAPAKADDATADDTAKFLAGLPVSAGSPLEPLTKTQAWKSHASAFDKAFELF